MPSVENHRKDSSWIWIRFGTSVTLGMLANVFEGIIDGLLRDGVARVIQLTLLHSKSFELDNKACDLRGTKFGDGELLLAEMRFHREHSFTGR